MHYVTSILDIIKTHSKKYNLTYMSNFSYD